MTRLDIPHGEIEAALRQFGSNTGGGFIDQYAREYLIRNHRPHDAACEDLESLVVAYRKGTRNPAAARLPRSSFAPRVKRGDAGYMGNPAVIVSRSETAQRRHGQADPGDRGRA